MEVGRSRGAAISAVMAVLEWGGLWGSTDEAGSAAGKDAAVVAQVSGARFGETAGSGAGVSGEAVEGKWSAAQITQGKGEWEKRKAKRPAVRKIYSRLGKHRR